MLPSKLPTLPLLLSLTTLTTLTMAQTFTACQPLNQTDCPADPALGMNYTFDFTKSTYNNIWNTTAGPITYGDAGAEFTISSRGQAPELQSPFYILFGEVEVWMRAASGQGIVSSVVLQSDDLDEIDWELIGGNDTHAETNYFGKGNTTDPTRANWFPLDQPQENFHNYTTRWTAEQTDFFIDSNLVRTLKPEEAWGGKNYPQTPMNVRIGIWAGGDSKNGNGTIEWAGGVTDYDKGPYTMLVSKVRVTDFSSGASYSYGDKSGTWQSIKVANGTSDVAHKIQSNQHTTIESASQRFDHYSTGVKIAILGSVGGVVALLVVLMTWCCITQRRAGKREKAMADAEWEKGERELLAHRATFKRMPSDESITSTIGPKAGVSVGAREMSRPF